LKTTIVTIGQHFLMEQQGHAWLTFLRLLVPTLLWDSWPCQGNQKCAKSLKYPPFPLTQRTLTQLLSVESGSRQYWIHSICHLLGMDSGACHDRGSVACGCAW